LHEGWELIDPLGLPNTIPSALATQLAIAFDLRAFAVAYLDGMLGFFHAIEFASYAILQNRTDMALVIGAEEITPVQELAHAALGRAITVCAGATGLVLTNCSQEAEWRIGLLGQGIEGDGRAAVPSHWQDAEMMVIRCSDNLPTLLSLAPAFAIDEVLQRGERRAILFCVVPAFGWRAVGFERERR
jgi:hypothetical protein